MRVRKVIRNLCFASSAGLMLLAVVGPPGWAQDPDDGRPSFWESSAFARAIEFSTNTDPLIIPVPDLIRADFSEAEANWSRFGEARARSAVLWPGKAVSDGPSLLCFSLAENPNSPFTCPEGFPPQYPLAVVAEGDQPDAAFEFGQEFGDDESFSGKAVVARAHAARDNVETVNEMGGFKIADQGGLNEAIADDMAAPLREVARELDAGVAEAAKGFDGAFRSIIEPFAAGGLPVLISPSFAVGAVFPSFEKALTFDVDDTLIGADAVATRTLQEFIEDNSVLVSRSEARLSGVKLFGGLITIDSVLSSVVSQVDAQGVGTVAETVRVGGLTVAGIPAGLTERGVVFGADGLLSGRDEAKIDVTAENVLGKSGVTLHLAGPEHENVLGNVTSAAAGVFAGYQLDANKVPGAGSTVFGTFALGNVATRAFVPAPFVPDGPGGGGGGGGGFVPPPFDPGGDGGGTTNVLSGTASNDTGDFAFQPGADDFVAAPPTEGSSGAVSPQFGGPAVQGRFGTELLGKVVANRITMFYLAWAFATVGFVLGSKAILPWRLRTG
jgi:hypothetical protein